MTRNNRDERGAVAIMVAVVSVTLFIVAAMVVDLGLARDTKRQSQSAADASALAAANALYPTPGAPDLVAAAAQAKQYAFINFGVALTAWNSCVDPAIGSRVASASTQCVSFDDADDPTNVRVVIPTRTVDTTLGALADVDEINIATAARAALDPGTLIECGLCVLGSGVHSIGNGDASVLSAGGAGIHINGSLAGQTNSEVTASGGSITIEGTFGASDFSPAPTQGPKIGDPMGSVVPPTYSDVNPKNKSNPCGASGGTGVYGSFDVGNSTCNLNPGLYVFTGTLQLGNNGQLLSPSNGVTLVFTCGTATLPRPCAGSGENGGIFDAKNGEVRITKGYSGPLGNLSDLVVFYDRTNTSSMTLQGNGASVLSGDVYAKSSLLYANGTSCHTVSGGAIVVNDIYMNGNNSCLKVANGIPATYELPPSGLRLDQ